MSHADVILSWLALAGWLYGFTSDWLGDHPGISANSVRSLLGQWFWGVTSPRQKRKTREEVANCLRDIPLSKSIAYLIEYGYFLRSTLLKNPAVKRVEVGLIGTHLVLTVYRSSELEEKHDS